MTTLHYLNVGAGDCTLIQHPSGRETMVDICGGNLRRQGIGDLMAEMAFGQRRGALEQVGLFGSLGGALTAPQHNSLLDLFPPPRNGLLGAFGGSAIGNALRGEPQGALSRLAELAGEQPRGNFAMNDERKNPLDYLDNIGVKSIFRFVSTHPEMDHLDGLDALFDHLPVYNFWHTGVQRPAPVFGLACPYNRADWTRYVNAVNSRIQGTTSARRRVAARFPYANQDNEHGTGVGDQLYILAPSDELVRHAEQSDDINEASYVLGLRTGAGVVLIPGDAHDWTWEYVLRRFPTFVQNCALLLAPHHGRDSGRDYEFLDVLRPRLTLMGCADSEHMGYESWTRRGLNFITNNQAGNIRVDLSGILMQVWVENATYARRRCGINPALDSHGMFHCGFF